MEDGLALLRDAREPLGDRACLGEPGLALGHGAVNGLGTRERVHGVVEHAARAHRVGHVARACRGDEAAQTLEGELAQLRDGVLAREIELLPLETVVRPAVELAERELGVRGVGLRPLEQRAQERDARAAERKRVGRAGR